MSKKVLAFDFGASNGRALLGEIVGDKITYSEIHRFSNDPVLLGGHMYWDFLRLFFEIKTGIIKAKQAGGFDSIGIDTWGVDFGFIDKQGKLMGMPYHYRDIRTENAMEDTFKIVDKKTVYEKTGIQFMRLNTLFQLYVGKREDALIVDNADKMLFIPDLFAYFLTGEKVAEYSIASTSQLLNPVTHDWNYDLVEAIGINKDILPKIVESGHIYGNLSKDICEELGVESVPVVAVCCHDTASAVASVPADMSECCYISSGTWSLMGVELDKPILSDEAYKENFTNEGGYNKTVRFLKNIMGLWIIQESKRQWEREGKSYSFSELADMAEKSESVCYIDPDCPDFETPGNMPQRIKDFAKRSGQKIPETVGEISRCIYESLALKYRQTLLTIEKLTGKTYKKINIIGGGCKAKFLCELAAEACEKEVVAGPGEATALGNIAVQFIALNEIDTLRHAKIMIANGEKLVQYVPQNKLKLDYNKYLSILGK